MNEKKFEAAKKKLKKYVPVITTATGVLATAYAFGVIRHLAKNTILLTPEDRELLQNEDGHIRYNIDGQSYNLYHFGKTDEN